ncbi:MAG: sensor histidine kinase, partial [Ruminococcus sp.]
LITDKKNQLVSVNNGNLMKTVENNEARDYAERVLESGRDSGKIKMDSSVYSYIVRELDEMNLIIFVNDSFTHTANSNLLKISLLVGFAVWIFLLILIIIVSGYVVKPVAENMERQKQFISNASHELKTPVTVISATIDIISSKKGSDRWTECIKEQTKKMQSLITELLDLSKLIENPDNRTGFEVCDISSAVSNSLLYFESLLFESGKTLNQNIDENILLKCDENKISQLTGILMDNALKYSDEKSEISFSLHREKDNAVMRCSNLCSDFSAKNTSRLFERFYRSDNDHTHEQEGFGLGLSIAQAITELHRGSINADYKDNTVTFTITLPIH